MLIVALCLCAPPELAPLPRPAPTTAEKLAAIDADRDRDLKAIRSRYQKPRMMVEEHRKQLAEEAVVYRAAAARTVAVAEAAGPATADGLLALEAALTYCWRVQDSTSLRTLELVATHHAATNPDAGRAVHRGLGYWGEDPTEVPLAAARSRLAVAAGRNPEPAVRGQVVLVQAEQAAAAFRRADEEGRSDAAALEGPMDALLDRLEREYGDCPNASAGGKSTLGQAASRLRPPDRTDRPAPPHPAWTWTASRSGWPTTGPAGSVWSSSGGPGAARVCGRCRRRRRFWRSTARRGSASSG